MTENPLAEMAAERENGLALVRWRPAQWQTIVRSRGALTLRRTACATALAVED